jgi:F-type H+-transporting ATPase subunit delta
MSDNILVKRYAESFLDFTREKTGLAKALEDTGNFLEVLRRHPEFLDCLKSFEITQAEKQGLIDGLLEQGFSEDFCRFLKFLTVKGHSDKIVEIAQYVRASYAHAGETTALLKTSFPLDLDLVKTIEEKMEEKFKKKFRFYIELDGNLLGGVQVVFGNTVIDGSVRRRLVDLKDQLQKVNV